MFDRRLLTDIGLALLIALPSALPAAPNPWNTSDQTGKPLAEPAQAAAQARGNVDFAQALPTGAR
jgi:hypothetical protein